ncbi:MAG: ATP-binding cassette domain-containing protein [candidate division WOR-3 bacterium]|nr:ATP-binding cassette domain-containing protein [candidate division WOR-3 bacterium]
MTPAIEVNGLARRFKAFTAVDGISFTVNSGEIFGFLGPNGAGKTTTVRMLCTLIRPSAGTARVAGFDLVHRQTDVRRSIGIIFQDPSLDDRLTARENLRFHAMVYKVPRAEVNARIAETLEWMELTDRANEIVRNFSGGMKRRLEIARGLLHSPRVLFLDEPTLGLDPQTRSRIWERLLKLRRERGTTLFLTTHYMDEAENCDRIAIIDHGRIIALDTPARLKAQVQGDCIHLETADDAAAEAEVKQRYGVEVVRDATGLHFEVENGAAFVPGLLRELSVAVRTVSVRPPTLEDVFLKMTGREIRDDEASGHEKLRSRLQRMGRAGR